MKPAPASGVAIFIIWASIFIVLLSFAVVRLDKRVTRLEAASAGSNAEPESDDPLPTESDGPSK
jgi:hypothetical protein